MKQICLNHSCLRHSTTIMCQFIHFSYLRAAQSKCKLLHWVCDTLHQLKSTSLTGTFFLKQTSLKVPLWVTIYSWPTHTTSVISKGLGEVSPNAYCEYVSISCILFLLYYILFNYIISYNIVLNYIILGTARAWRVSVLCLLVFAAHNSVIPQYAH